MQKYQLFAASATMLILANYWHLVSNSPLIPLSLDYLAYAFFIFGIYKTVKNAE